MLDTCWTRFEHSSHVNISGVKLSIISPFSVQIMSYLGASDRSIKMLASSPVEFCMFLKSFKKYEVLPSVSKVLVDLGSGSYELF